MSDPFSPGDVQLKITPGMIDFRWGHPAAELMPAGEFARAADAALARNGVAALSYGRNGGPKSLIEPLSDWLARNNDPIPEGRRMFITAGISQGLDLICTLFSSPGEVVLVESPVYHLALKVFRDHQLTLVPVEADAEGMQPAALSEALEQVRAAGGLPRFIYTVPTFGNPSGSLMPAARRREIVSLAQSAGTLILEDDVYRHLWFEVPPPSPLQLYGPPRAVVRFGSFSKLLAPGLRLGWLLASPEIVERCKDSGLLDSGGGLSHLVAHMAGEFIHMGLLDPQVTRLRAGYRARCMALLEGLAAEMPAGVTWTQPGGGFFTWMTLPQGLESAAMQPSAAEEGVAYVTGEPFCCCGGGERNLRLAFSLLSPDELNEGAGRLGRAIRRKMAGGLGEQRDG